MAKGKLVTESFAKWPNRFYIAPLLTLSFYNYVKKGALEHMFV